LPAGLPTGQTADIVFTHHSAVSVSRSVDSTVQQLVNLILWSTHAFKISAWSVQGLQPKSVRVGNISNVIVFIALLSQIFQVFKMCISELLTYPSLHQTASEQW